MGHINEGERLNAALDLLFDGEEKNDIFESREDAKDFLKTVLWRLVVRSPEEKIAELLTMLSLATRPMPIQSAQMIAGADIVNTLRKEKFIGVSLNGVFLTEKGHEWLKNWQT